MAENIKSNTKIDQVEETEMKDSFCVPVSEVKYKITNLENCMNSSTYQMKIILLVAWKLMYQDANMSDWSLATKMHEAYGFHDLILKYQYNHSAKYSCVQIKHEQDLKNKINSLMFLDIAHNQYSFINLFKIYWNMMKDVNNRKNTGVREIYDLSQVQDVTIFTNKGISVYLFKYLVPEKNDIFSFGKKGLRYRINIEKFKTEQFYMECLRSVIQDDKIITEFLSKLVLMINQPSESELEEIITREIGKIVQYPQFFYKDLYKSINEWFPINECTEVSYLTKWHIMKCLKNTQKMLLNTMKIEMPFDVFTTNLSSELKNKFKFLYL